MDEAKRLIGAIRAKWDHRSIKRYAQLIEEGLKSVSDFKDYDANAIAEIAARDSMLWETYADMTAGMSRKLNTVIVDAFAKPGEFDITGMKRRMREMVSEVADARLETIARTETLAAVNAGREAGYVADFGLEGKYIFLHPEDARECSECVAVVDQIGDGKSLQEVKDIIRRVSIARNGPGWVARDFVPHPGCRGILLRVE